MKKLLILLATILLLFSCATSEDSANQVLANSQYYSSKGEYEKAIKEIDQYGDFDYKLSFNKALYLSELEKYEESLDVLEILIREDGNRLQYLKLKAWNLAYLNRTNEFISILDELYSIKPLDLKISETYIEEHKKLKDWNKVRLALQLLIDADVEKDKSLKKLLEVEKELKTREYPYYNKLIGE